MGKNDYQFPVSRLSELGDCRYEVWTPSRAWRALEQLRAALAIGPMKAFLANRINPGVAGDPTARFRGGRDRESHRPFLSLSTRPRIAFLRPRFDREREIL